MVLDVVGSSVITTSNRLGTLAAAWVFKRILGLESVDCHCDQSRVTAFQFSTLAQLDGRLFASQRAEYLLGAPPALDADCSGDFTLCRGISGSEERIEYGSQLRGDDLRRDIVRRD